MGKVAILFKVFPKDSNVDMSEVMEKTKSIEGVKDAKLEELAFGIKTIKLLVVAENAEKAREVEQRLREIDGVGEVQIESTSLV